MNNEFKKAQGLNIELDDVHEATAEMTDGEYNPEDAGEQEEGLDIQHGVGTINAEHNVPPLADEQDLEQPLMEEVADEIKSTDIVFSCPACGHSLAIDYRGAGLEINCTQCGMPTLVPIPGGMEVSDLDISAGELLAQLFQTRTMVHKRDQQISELTQIVESLRNRRSDLERSRMNFLHRNAELAHMCQSINRNQTEITGILNRMLTLIAEEQQL